MYPSFVSENPELYDFNKWYENPVMQTGNIKAEYDKVAESFDDIIKKHGYERDGMFYHAVNSNNDTIMLFCHFGVECVLLSHLLNLSPVIIWQAFCAAPTSVTTVFTEERQKGIVQFRVQSFGDVSHLYAGDEPVSFQARFCEAYDNDERH